MPYVGEVGQVLGVVAVGEDAAVHLRVQRHHAVAEDRREPGDLGGVGDGEARVAQRRRRAAARQQVDHPSSCSARASSTTPVLS